MDVLEQVLRWVHSGNQSFEPVSNSTEDVQKFQVVTEAIIYAQQLGYLRDCKPMYESTTGRRQCVLVVVIGGLTYPGRKFLEELDHQNRAIPETIQETMFGIPTSGDATIDDLVRQAIGLFRTPNINSRKVAVEKLWDAWERLKTFPDPNPAQGNKILLDAAANEPNFRVVLEQDAKQLLDAGNNFHIRHFKTGTTEIARIEQYDYLFHRLLALMNLLLIRIRKNNPACGRA